MSNQALGIGSAVMLIFFLASPLFAASKGPVKQNESLRRGEIRATLNPEQFSNIKVAVAYRIAKEIPGVLDSIYCHCQCEESPVFRHKSLLSCYVDNHAAM